MGWGRGRGAGIGATTGATSSLQPDSIMTPNPGNVNVEAHTRRADMSAITRPLIQDAPSGYLTDEPHMIHRQDLVT